MSDKYDLSTPDGCRLALAAETTAFMFTPREERDINAFRAVVQALAALLQDFSRQSENDLESDIATMTKRLDEWERERGNVNE